MRIGKRVLVAAYSVRIAARDSAFDIRFAGAELRIMSVNASASSAGRVTGGRRGGKGTTGSNTGCGLVASDGGRGRRGNGRRATTSASFFGGRAGAACAAAPADGTDTFARALASARASALPNGAALPRSPAFAPDRSALILRRRAFILFSSSLVRVACLANQSCSGRVTRALL